MITTTLYIDKNRPTTEHFVIEELMKEKKLKLEKIDISTLSENELKQIRFEMRMIRPFLRTVDWPEDRWSYEQLSKTPILKTNIGTYPWWYLIKLEYVEKILDQLSELIKLQPKLTIRRITKQTQRNDVLTVTQEDLARVNVTMLRVINGTSITEIAENWSTKEKAAALIMWRLAQHQRSNDLRVLADMITEKAKLADPFHEEHDDDNDMDD